MISVRLLLRPLATSSLCRLPVQRNVRSAPAIPLSTSISCVPAQTRVSSDESIVKAVRYLPREEFLYG